MSQGDQDAWLEAAFKALEGVPLAPLRKGARAAMAKADHPSKIIPAIMAEIEADWAWRRENKPWTRPEGLPSPRPIGALMDKRGSPMTDEETEILNKHLAFLGSHSRYRPDGTREA